MGTINLDENIRLKFDKASDKYYVFSISTGDHYTLTKIGFEILDLVGKNKNIEEIINFIHEKESVDLDTCKTDTLDFLNKCEKLCIIVNNNEGNGHEKKKQNQ